MSATLSPATAATTFTAATTPPTFDERLPVEIREVIWKAMMPPRIIEVYITGVELPNEMHHHLKANYNLSKVFHIRKESRKLALETYVLLSGRDEYPLQVGNTTVQDGLHHLMRGEDIGELPWACGFSMLRSFKALVTLTVAIDPAPTSIFSELMEDLQTEENEITEED
ncbi:uncharacterized protein PAC_17443 [Phialocephala subalpina]|uniref:2EXR domain-containing protein n=1 Tax=Phialocephala subalpina TaxID=576137 RepID=A0A1L7XR76_9HELO|nr:uncharacterized protein PAC_17443 [Phialocephala subalpina]